MAIDYRQVILDQTEAMASTVRHHDDSVRVPSCPEWDLGDLAVHMGVVQRWATHIISNGVMPETMPEGGREHAAEFLAAGLKPLLEAIDGANPDDAAWNFTGMAQTKAFWPRRQALEVTMHRWDADAAVGAQQPLDAVLAAATVDEYLHLLVPRMIRRNKLDLHGLTGDVHVHCTDTAGEWTFAAVEGLYAVTDEHRKAAVAVRGAASDVALFLNNRGDGQNLEILGDREVLDSWLRMFRF
jgi:uncharacterized protein (TIGR03083 family)